jgi:hypothetical protein
MDIEHWRLVQKRKKQDRVAFTGVLLLVLHGWFTFAETPDDYIQMRNGTGARTRIVDTADCYVTILRRGKETKLKRKLVDFLVIAGDTVNVDASACQNKKAKIMRVEDTPEYRLAHLVDTWPRLDQVVDTGRTIAYLRTPLLGHGDSTFVEQLEYELLPILSGHGHTTVVPPKSLWACVVNHCHNFQYCFLIKTVRDVVNRQPGVGGDLIRFNPSGKTREVYTMAEFAVVDLSNRSVVFHHITSKKKNVFQGGRSGNFVVDAILANKREKWAEEGVEKGKDRNNRRIVRDISKALQEHLSSD